MSTRHIMDLEIWKYEVGMRHSPKRNSTYPKPECLKQKGSQGEVISLVSAMKILVLYLSGVSP